MISIPLPLQSHTVFKSENTAHGNIMETKAIDNKIDISNDNATNQSKPITTCEFLDFLKLACRVHESIILKDENGKPLDYNALAKNELVNALVNSKSNQSPKSNGVEDNFNDKIGK